MNRLIIFILAVFASSLFAEYTLLSESFEGTFPPTGWTLQTTGLGFTKQNSRYNTGSYSMGHGYDFVGDQNDWAISSQISIPACVDSVKLTFWQNEDWESYYDTHEVWISTNLSTWTIVYSGVGTEDTWTSETIDLEAWKGENIYIGFHYVGNGADWWYIDDVEVKTYGGFIKRDTGITPLEGLKIDWADHDGNNNFDIAVNGNTAGDLNETFMNLYSGINESDFILDSSMPGVRLGSVQMKDIGGSDFTDIIYTGYNASGRHTEIFEQGSDGQFYDQRIDDWDIVHVYSGCTDVGDYDNDGDEDILITGSSSSGNISRIYRNDGNYTYTDIEAGLTGVWSSDAAWGDYDNDGDLDLVIAGDTGSAYIAKIYRNDNGTFTDINAGLIGVESCSVDWGDYDCDGDLDLALTGYTGTTRVTRIYRQNYGSTFQYVYGLTGVSSGSAKWGDFDNNGYPDLLVTGLSSTGYLTKLYRNNGGSLSSSGYEFVNLMGKGLWADHDHDGDLDFLVYGYNGTDYEIVLYENDSDTPNTVPASPSGFSIDYSDDTLTFTFNSSTDAETPSSGLTYNARFRVRDIYLNYLNSRSDGTRKITEHGNIFKNTSWSIAAENLMRPQEYTPVTIYAQAIDNCFAGSAIATYSDYSHRKGDLSLYNGSVLGSSDELSWDADFYSDMDSYVIQFDEVSGFTSPYEETIVLSKESMKGLKYSVVISDLTSYASMVDGQTYYWRIKPVYTGSAYTTYFTATPATFTLYKQNQLPSAPVSGFTPANDDITDSLPLISWGNGSDPDGHAEDLRYSIELDDENTFASPLFTDTTDPGETYYQASGLTDGYRYYYRVKTIDTADAESSWSAIQQFVVVMPPQNVKVTYTESYVAVDWDDMPVNSKGVVYTVYSSDDPYAEFPGGWNVSAVNLNTSIWYDSPSAEKKFYRVTAGSSSK